MATSLLMSLAIDEDADLAEDGIIVTMWFIEEGDSPTESSGWLALLQARVVRIAALITARRLIDQ